MTNQREDKELCPWMAPLLKMTAEHLAAVDQTATYWTWILKLSRREMARLLMRILEARGALDLTLAATDILLKRLGAIWPSLRIAEQVTWEPLVMEARTRSLTARGALPPASTGVAPTEEPTT